MIDIEYNLYVHKTNLKLPTKNIQITIQPMFLVYSNKIRVSKYLLNEYNTLDNLFKNQLTN